MKPENVTVEYVDCVLSLYDDILGGFTQGTRRSISRLHNSIVNMNTVYRHDDPRRYEISNGSGGLRIGSRWSMNTKMRWRTDDDGDLHFYALPNMPRTYNAFIGGVEIKEDNNLYFECEAACEEFAMETDLLEEALNS